MVHNLIIIIMQIYQTHLLTFNCNKINNIIKIGQNRVDTLKIKNKSLSLMIKLHKKTTNYDINSKCNKKTDIVLSNIIQKYQVFIQIDKVRIQNQLFLIENKLWMGS